MKKVCYLRSSSVYSNSVAYQNDANALALSRVVLDPERGIPLDSLSQPSSTTPDVIHELPTTFNTSVAVRQDYVTEQTGGLA